MKQVAAVGVVLLLLLFLLPLLMIGDKMPQREADPPPATLPIDRPVITPAAAAVDGARMVKVQLGEGDIVDLTMDKYLWRVVAAEMPASFQPEALKAQTVAARTYTVSKMMRTVERHPKADMCSDITCCQAYIAPEDAAGNWGENAQSYTDKIAAAVAGTDGVVALYNGQPIQAVFFSSAAGRTVDAVEVWGNAVPYLTGVDSPEGESQVPNYHSLISVSLEEFKTKFLAAHGEADLSGSPENWIQNPVLNSAGGVATMAVGGVVVRGSELRTLFSLRSSSFTVAANELGVTFSVTGYGHGVGMSQYGANTMAAEGKTYTEILQWYYSGITLTPWAG